MTGGCHHLDAESSGLRMTLIGAPARPHKAGLALRITLIAVGCLVVACVDGGLISLWWFGRDDPAQYEDRVEAIEKRFEDGYPVGGVVLAGSSFFERWSTSVEDLSPLPVTNIGIGGTKVGDHLAYFDRMVVPFQPSVLVLYIGSNDIGGIPLYTKSAEATVDLITDYIAKARAARPHARIYYVAITEAPARESVRADIQTANRLLADAASASGEFRFVETAPSLLLPDGSMDESLFGSDRLHFNEKGYAQFAEAVRAGLQDEFDRSWPVGP